MVKDILAVALQLASALGFVGSLSIILCNLIVHVNLYLRHASKLRNEVSKKHIYSDSSDCVDLTILDSRIHTISDVYI